MMRKMMLFCCGLSGSGKSHFIRHHLPDGLFYKLISCTTRPPRPGEVDGREYYFCNESAFDATALATRLWVNQKFWTPDKPKWLYGVPETEILNHLDKNLVYDVIQPMYARQMIDWAVAQHLNRRYVFRVAYFLPHGKNFDVAASRANMPDDMLVRIANTCDVADFVRARLPIHYVMQPIDGHISPRFIRDMSRLSR